MKTVIFQKRQLLFLRVNDSFRYLKGSKLFILFPYFLLMSCQILTAQISGKLPVPKNVQQAYKQGTRATDGRPGPNYWQNRAEYTINVSVMPPDRTIVGRETITYYNESPDTLDKLVIRIYQDVYKKGNPRDFYAKTNDLHDGVQISEMVINGKKISVKDNPEVEHRKTNLFVKMSPEIAPHSSVNLEISWQFPLALNSNERFGGYDSTSFFLAYWYPQIAVYDDIDGWDEFNFHGIQEFYNDFNNYDVSVTVPEGFVVWATGRLQNPEEVFTGNIFSRYKQVFNDTALIHVITAEDLKKGNITAQNKTNTWHFQAENVNDFAFGTSDHYVWDLTGLPAENHPGGRILIGAAYKDGTKFLSGVTQLQKRTIRFFSNEMPGVSYPFPSFTLFQLRGGMEYPMMNSQGELPELSYYVFVTTHELAHSYFPMLVGNNERKYGWMDEAWAMYLPVKLQKRELGGFDVVPQLSKMFYSPFIGTSFDLPTMTPSIVYGTDVFDKYRYVICHIRQTFHSVSAVNGNDR